jgi:two-component system sensor histidine kinase KdpD
MRLPLQQPADLASERLFYLGAGPTAAILLGMLLVPLRELTTASNLTFAFLALTIAVAEFGGRWAALVTALMSALSLNFFLTQPYLTLVIDKPDDVLAFVGLALCGLLVASLAAARNRRLEMLEGARGHLELLRAGLAMADPASLEPALAYLLRAGCDTLPLSAAVVRDARGYVLAASDNAAGLRDLPERELTPDSPAFPAEGGRIALLLGTQRLGWLDVWGSGAPARAESRRSLADTARLAALLIAGAAAAAPPRHA